MSLLRKAENGKVLFAVAWEYVNERGIVTHTDIDYFHADSAGQARLQFFADKRYYWRFNVVGIAPAIGAFATDNHGEKLIA